MKIRNRIIGMLLICAMVLGNYSTILAQSDLGDVEAQYFSFSEKDIYESLQKCDNASLSSDGFSKADMSTRMVLL